MKKLTNSSEDKPEIVENDNKDIIQFNTSIIAGNKNSVMIFLIFNVALILIVSLVLIDKMIQGSTYSNLIFLVSTITFFISISLSIIYLLSAFSKIVDLQNLVFNSQLLRANANTKHQLYNPLEELKSLFISSSNSIKKSVYISGISSIVFLFLLILIYFNIL